MAVKPLQLSDWFTPITEIIRVEHPHVVSLISAFPTNYFHCITEFLVRYLGH